MKKWFLFVIYMVVLHSGEAQDLRATLFEDADSALQAARDVNAQLLAPQAFGRGLDFYADAEDDLARGRNIERIRDTLSSTLTSFSTSSPLFSFNYRVTSFNSWSLLYVSI